ncbi:MAG: hypothetical protein U1E76_15710 [Planctomycetota bacterium]
MRTEVAFELDQVLQHEPDREDAAVQQCNQHGGGRAGNERAAVLSLGERLPPHRAEVPDVIDERDPQDRDQRCEPEQEARRAVVDGRERGVEEQRDAGCHQQPDQVEREPPRRRMASLLEQVSAPEAAAGQYRK